jgi:hypothetical protein
MDKSNASAPAQTPGEFVTLASPKARFIQSGTRVSDHRRMVGSDIFDQATDAAMLHYSIQLARNTTDGNTGMVNGLKIAGAQEFLVILKTLAETPRPMPRPNIVGLDPAN